MKSFKSIYLIILNIILVNSYTYPSSYYNYYIPQFQTYNVCPEQFYFYDYEPLIIAQQPVVDPNEISTDIVIPKNKTAKAAKRINSNLKGENATKFQSQLLPPPPALIIEGPFWIVFSQAYEKCCPLNSNRIKPVQLKSQISFNRELFDSFSNQTHIINFQSQGMFGIIELFNQFQQFDANSFNPHSVQILSSSGFYLISKRDFNGAPTMTPIALSTLLNAWPIFVIILLANGYAAIFIWFLDKALKTNQFPKPFTNGTGHGMWWTFFLFTATSLSPNFRVKTAVIRVFTVIWMIISLIIIIIFISMFTSSLTMYAMNGQSLIDKAIGINKYSTDRIWIDTENAIAVEYNALSDMLRDLDEMKLDYILLDQLYAGFYSRIILERFYVMRFVNRKRAFNVLLRGFNTEQLSCFQTTSAIYFHDWLKLNVSANANKIKDTSKYFNLTDELLYPHRNVILITALVLLTMIIIAGISWQVTCMSQPPMAGSAQQAAGGAMRRRPPSRGRGRGLGEEGPLGGISSMFGGGGGGAGARGGGAHQTPITGFMDNLNVRSLIPGGLLSAPTSLMHDTQFQDRSVKFNPLVHNFYYNKASDAYDKALMEARDQALIKNAQKMYQLDSENHKIAYATSNWDPYRPNDSGFEEIVKENPAPLRSMNPGGIYEYQSMNMYSPSTSKIPIVQSTPNTTLNRYASPPIYVSHEKLISMKVPNSSDKYIYDSSNLKDDAHITKVDLAYSSQYTQNAQTQQQNKIKKAVNYRKGIVLNSSNSISSIYNQESNTDEHIANENNNLNQNMSNPSSASLTQTNQFNETIGVAQTANADNSASQDAQNNLNQSTASAVSNPMHKELPRNESIYALNEISSVKL